MKNSSYPLRKTGQLNADQCRHICLNGNEVAYTLMRRRRKSIGIKIDRHGLTVRIPSRESLSWVESVLRNKANWIVTKLHEWKNRKPSGAPVWEDGSIFPLLGHPWQVTVTPAGALLMIPLETNSGGEEKQLRLPLPSLLTAQQIERAVMEWYRNQALACFSKRMALYAQKLGVKLPRLRLSHARTLWGSCDARGVIRLNWRLIQKPLDLVDYVVAHELSHLIEMNHSAAFWQTVERVYPDYRTARQQLRADG